MGHALHRRAASGDYISTRLDLDYRLGVAGHGDLPSPFQGEPEKLGLFVSTMPAPICAPTRGKFSGVAA
jgi:hypothetical protein